MTIKSKARNLAEFLRNLTNESFSNVASSNISASPDALVTSSGAISLNQLKDVYK